VLLKDIPLLRSQIGRRSFLVKSALWNKPVSEISPAQFVAALKRAQMDGNSSLALSDAHRALFLIRKAIAAQQIGKAPIECLSLSSGVSNHNVYQITHGIEKAVARQLMMK